MTQREVAKEILGNDNPESIRQIGKWQDLLEAYGVIKRVREAVKGKNSRGYVWIWNPGQEAKPVSDKVADFGHR